MEDRTPILFQNHDQTVILLDLPRSLEYAQSSHLQIRSVKARSQPYPSVEPKTPSSTDTSNQRTEITQLEQDIVAALDEIRASFAPTTQQWCCPRFERIAVDTVRRDVDSGPGKTEGLQVSGRCCTIKPPIILSHLSDHNAYRSMFDMMDSVVCNPVSFTSVLVGVTEYRIPPRSAFIWSTIHDGWQAFHAACPLLLSQDSSPICQGQFDIVLMDPPWQNRSARRKRSYATDENHQDSTFLSTVPILKHHLSARGLVAIWVTNKDTLKEDVLKALRPFGLRLQQDWTWVKVTSTGQPVTDLGGTWRKPYERLLIFGHADVPPSRKIIVAVPDIHSRKPSLKHLFDQLLPPEPRVLELFARSCTTGWWSWGDQVLSFQNAKDWRCGESV
jgi:N6-adenosine-specific RNA methylase IME4